jgi:hypothetical protein
VEIQQVNPQVLRLVVVPNLLVLHLVVVPSLLVLHLVVVLNRPMTKKMMMILPLRLLLQVKHLVD